MARLEKDIFITLYSIRKLIEANKISDRTSSCQFTLIAYPAKGKMVTKMNWHKLEELFYLDNPHPVNKEALFICNQIIHSYIFVPSFNTKNRLEGILFCSDRERNKQLYHLKVDALIRFMERVGKDYPTKLSMIFNQEKKDYQFKLK